MEPIPKFNDHIFVGHYPTPDLDSIASAVGAAEFFQGLPATPAALNAESKFILDKYKLEYPPLLDGLLKNDPTTNYVLVDHNVATQMSPLLETEFLAGIVDHHTIGVTPKFHRPTYVDIRAWGSCSTIITFQFMEHPTVHLRAAIAGLLLGGIISDTLNLRSPTSTPHDAAAMGYLSAKLGLKSRKDIDSNG